MRDQIDQEEVMEIDLKEVFFELLSHIKAIIASAVLVGAICFGISYFLLTPQYESKASMYVLSKSTSITSLADVQMGTSLTNDYLVVVKSRPVLEQVIAQLNLKGMSYNQLLGKITVSNPTSSRILEVTVRDADPRQAKVIADTVAEVSAAFISEKMDQDPPNIIQRGYTDGSPVSPNIKKNTLIGFAAGAVVAMVVVFLAFMFNDTIITPEDVESKLGINVLGTIPLEEKEYDGSKKSRRKSKRKSVA